MGDEKINYSIISQKVISHEMLWDLAAQFNVHVTLDLVTMAYNSTCLPKSSYVFS